MALLFEVEGSARLYGAKPIPRVASGALRALAMVVSSIGAVLVGITVRSTALPPPLRPEGSTQLALLPPTPVHSIVWPSISIALIEAFLNEKLAVGSSRAEVLGLIVSLSVVGTPASMLPPVYWTSIEIVVGSRPV